MSCAGAGPGELEWRPGAWVELVDDRASRAVSGLDLHAGESRDREVGPRRGPSAGRVRERPPDHLWLRGGCSHLDTYDPKPDAPSEYRGPFATIATKTPGLRFTELLPRQASISDQFTVLRSMAHTGGGHPAGSLQLLSGDPDAQDKLKPVYPDFMSVAHYLRSGQPRALPNYVGVNPITRYDNFTIAGPAYLGPVVRAVRGDGRPERAAVSRCRTSASPTGGQADRLRQRIRLRRSFDELRREIDRSGRDAGDGRVRGAGARNC